MNCERCGAPLKVGDWPFCNGDPTQHVSGVTFGEEPLTPYFDHELGAEVRTRGERRALMRDKGLDYVDLSSKRRGKIYVTLGGK